MKNIWKNLEEAIKNNQTAFKFDLSFLSSKEVIPTFQKLKNQGYDVQVESEKDSVYFEFKLKKSVKDKKSKVDFSIFKKEPVENIQYTRKNNLIYANFKGDQ